MNNINFYIKDNDNVYQKIDLFDDEKVLLNSSIQDVKDITKTYTDFTHTFKVPASRTNNKIFQHWEMKVVDNGFDARTRSDAYIEINYTPFKNGNIQLNGVTMRDGKPHTYKLTFFGLLVNLKDKFKDDTLADLDWSDVDHSYDFENVKKGMGEVISGSIIYPMISPEYQWYYDSNSTATGSNENTRNIHYESGTEKSLSWNEMKPAITIMKIIEVIEDEYDISFSRDFLDTTPFDDLYMWLSREKGKVTLESVDADVEINFTSSQYSSGMMNFTTNTYAGEVTNWDSQNYTEAYTYLEITPKAGFESVPYSVQVKDGSEVITSRTDLVGTHTIYTNVDVSVNDGIRYFSLQWFIGANQGFEYTPELELEEIEVENGYGSAYSDLQYGPETSLVASSTINRFFPNLKVVDFINGIIKMFNLVVIPTGDNSIYIDTLDTWYTNGGTVDITNRVSTGTYDIDRVDVPSYLGFEFKEAKTIIANQYLETNPVPYGDLEYTVVDLDNNKRIYGKDLRVKLPFEQMIYDRLIDPDGTTTNIQYGAVIDDKLDPVLMSPHIFYGLQQQCSGSSFGLSGDTNITEMTSSFMPFHGDDQSSPSHSTTWGSEINEWSYSSNLNSMFKIYWQDYVSDLYDKTRRMYKYEAIVSHSQLLKLGNLKEYSKILISDNQYIINSVKMDLKTNKVKLELLNDVYVNPDVTPPLQVLFVYPTRIDTDGFYMNYDYTTDDNAVTRYTLYKDSVYYSHHSGTSFPYFSVSGETNGTTADWYVTATDLAGNESTPSDTETITIGDNVRTLLAPTNFTAVETGPTTIELNWTDSTSTDIVEYGFTRGGIVWGKTTAGYPKPHDYSGLTPGSTTEWGVVAIDKWNNESPISNTVIVTQPT